MSTEAAHWSPFEPGPEPTLSQAQSGPKTDEDSETAPCNLQRHLHVVPDTDAGQTGSSGPKELHPAPESAPETAASPAAETAPATEPEADTVEPSETAEADQPAGRSLAERLGQFRAIWVPPNWRTERPASIDEVVAYADTAPWCAGEGKARKAGRAYNRAVAVPVTALAYALAWVAQRPGRASTVGAAVLLWTLILAAAF